MPIPQTSKKLMSITGGQRNTSNLIGFMKVIGLLSDEDPSYQHNAYYDEDNHSKTYRYYYDNELKIKQYCDENHVNMFEWKNVSIKKRKKPVLITSFERKEVKFSSQLHLLKPENYTKKQFEEYLLDCLHENYPEWEEYQDLADYINWTYYREYPDFQMRFYNVKFTWEKGDKAVTKIGIRATNSLCGAAKSKKDKSDYMGWYRDDILKENGLNLHKDVSSSVPRITLSLNAGR